MDARRDDAGHPGGICVGRPVPQVEVRLIRPHDGPIVLDNMQTIDVTAMGEEILGLNHNVFAVSRNLIDDIRHLITSGLRPPDRRLSQIRPCPETSPRYWCFVH